MIFFGKPIKILPFIVLIFMSCTPTEKNGFKLDANIKGLKNNVVKLTYAINDSSYKKNTKAVEGNFTFKGQVPHPTLAKISLGNEGQIKFYLENSNITIRGNIDSLNAAKIKGGDANNVYLEYKKERENINDSYTNLIDKLKKLREQPEDNGVLKRKLLQEHDSLIQKRQEITKRLIKKYPKSYVSLQEMSGLIKDNDYKELSKLYDQLAADLKKSKLGSEIKNSIEKKKNTRIGAQAPVFSLPNLNGEKINLKSFRGKYVLVDFWASWCIPCRKEHPNYVEAYKNFKDQNFTILGVSLDRNKENWKKAVKKDGLTWTQLWSSEGVRSEVAQTYNIISIPKNFLLNPKGKIIAKDLRGNELEKKLNAVLTQ